MINKLYAPFSQFQSLSIILLYISSSFLYKALFSMNIIVCNLFSASIYSSLFNVGSVLMNESLAEHIILQFFQYEVYLPFLSLSLTNYFSGVTFVLSFSYVVLFVKTFFICTKKSPITGKMNNDITTFIASKKTAQPRSNWPISLKRN